MIVKTMGPIRMMSQQPSSGNRDLSVAYYHANQLGSFQDIHKLRRMHGPRRVITFCLLTAVLPTVLLVIPLYLRHSVYADVSYEVTESDVLEMVDGISSVFCQFDGYKAETLNISSGVMTRHFCDHLTKVVSLHFGLIPYIINAEEHGLKMNSTFSAYKLDGEPTISPERKHVHLKKSMSLPDDTLEYWGFYLLEGSTVVVTVCSRYDGGRIMLVRGERNLKTCGLLHHNSKRQSIQQGGASGKEQLEGNNVRMIFERKPERKPEGALESPEVDEGGRRLSGSQEVLRERMEDTDAALTEGDHVDEGGEEVWGNTGGSDTGGTESGRSKPREGTGRVGDDSKVKYKLEAKKAKEGLKDDDEDDDDDDDDDGDDGDGDDEDYDDDEERSGHGDLETLQRLPGFKRLLKQKSQLYSDDEGRAGDGDISEDQSEVLRQKKKLKKLNLAKTKDLDGQETKTHRHRRSGSGPRHVDKPRVGRLERLRRDLDKEDNGGGGEKVKRRQKREDVRLVDTGLKHGGTAIGYVKRESEEDSDSSFELGLKECYGGLIEHHRSFQPSETCTEDVASESTDINGAEESKNSLRFAYDIVESGYYYFIFYSDNDLVTNTMHAAFDIHKTVYEYGSGKTGNSTEKCVNTTECTFSVGFLSGATVMVEIPHRDGIDRDVMDEVGGPQGALLISSCYPRMSVYIVFPITVLFLILGCAFL